MNLKVGDRLHCVGLIEMYSTIVELEKQGIEANCVGQNGDYWLDITKVKENGKEEKIHRR